MSLLLIKRCVAFKSLNATAGGSLARQGIFKSTHANTTDGEQCVFLSICMQAADYPMHCIDFELTHWAREKGRHFANDTVKCIFVNENLWNPIKISLQFVPKGPINNIQALVQIMAWRRPGDKPLSEPMMVRLPTHICVTRPQWVNDGVPS